MSENKKLEIYESNLNAAYQVANENGGDERLIRLLDALTGKTATEGNRPKPSLDDYKTIQSYEDACEALDETPILSEEREKALCAQFPDHWDYRQDMPKHIIALMKLETISRALWGRNFKPKPDGKGSQILWYPWFALYTQEEVDRMDEDQRGALLAAHASWYGCGFRLSACAPSLLVLGCEHWVPLVPGNGGESRIFRKAVYQALG